LNRITLAGSKNGAGLVVAVGVGLVGNIYVAWADETPAASAPVAITTPAMSFPLAANPNPTSFTAGPLGKVYVTGAVTGLGVTQENPILSPSNKGNDHSFVDISNGQVFIQKIDGLIQYFIEAGAYSLPALGSPYMASGKTTDELYGALPQAFIKIAPNDSFSVMAGKLPTLIGAEYTFTFENTNIERGLLWNQENAVNRGVQANYTSGPLAVSVSWNDGFYSDRYDWISGAVTYTFDPSNVLSFAGAGNVGHNQKSTLATPVLQNNSDIYNVIYTHKAGAWTLQPYFQYTHVPSDNRIGTTHAASTYGGALLVNYAFDSNYSLAGRVEYISSSGSKTDGAPSLLYGPGSDAWSVTLTPTYQNGVFFTRGELSYVGASDTTPGFVFGQHGTNTKQGRALVEAGFLF
jgi:hypothetical protein